MAENPGRAERSELIAAQNGSSEETLREMSDMIKSLSCELAGIEQKIKEREEQRQARLETTLQDFMKDDDEFMQELQAQMCHLKKEIQSFKHKIHAVITIKEKLDKLKSGINQRYSAMTAYATELEKKLECKREELKESRETYQMQTHELDDVKQQLLDFKNHTRAQKLEIDELLRSESDLKKERKCLQDEIASLKAQAANQSGEMATLRCMVRILEPKVCDKHDGLLLENEDLKRKVDNALSRIKQLEYDVSYHKVVKASCEAVLANFRSDNKRQVREIQRANMQLKAYEQQINMLTEENKCYRQMLKKLQSFEQVFGTFSDSNSNSRAAN